VCGYEAVYVWKVVPILGNRKRPRIRSSSSIT